ncbi:A/G-specific adenine glycosylase [Candidatus Woesearchaeota archaeon]|nr:A/G-specific adenine glycosylase [Candidatus Woesearchaeota archaeon]
MNFSHELLIWYSLHKRDLPWRHNPTPYQVLVSEIMLQQTQVPRVIEKYKEFLGLFPTLEALAKASKAEVIQAWSGLGYNRRALLLQKFAVDVVNKYERNIPRVREALIKLPGMGPYTTGAVLSFAFNQEEPAIDVNVRRIFLRYFEGKDQGEPLDKTGEKKLFDLAKKEIPFGKSSMFHNALMDFGSLVCMRKNPVCSSCPLRQECRFFPLYEKDSVKVLQVREKKVEQGVWEIGKFIPNRIFRGRIVEWVRKNEGQKIEINELGKAVKKDYKKEEEEWLLILCSKLQKEGLFHFSQEKNMIIFTL